MHRVAIFTIAVGQQTLPDRLDKFLTLVDLPLDLDGRILHRDGLDFSRILYFKRYFLGKVIGPRRHHFAQRVGARCKMFDAVRLVG